MMIRFFQEKILRRLRLSFFCGVSFSFLQASLSLFLSLFCFFLFFSRKRHHFVSSGLFLQFGRVFHPHLNPILPAMCRRLPSFSFRVCSVQPMRQRRLEFDFVMKIKILRIFSPTSTAFSPDPCRDPPVSLLRRSLSTDRRSLISHVPSKPTSKGVPRTFSPTRAHLDCDSIPRAQVNSISTKTFFFPLLPAHPPVVHVPRSDSRAILKRLFYFHSGVASIHPESVAPPSDG